jgi:hypothetical protein
MSNCRLCGKERQLKKSHILPEWTYTTIYSKKGIFRPVSLNDSVLGKSEQKGYRERLLCKDCELLFSKYERYAKDFFYSIINNKYKNIERITLSSELFILKGFNYDLVKLCLLSILWRMSICSLDFFDGYKIYNEEEIRKILLNKIHTSKKYIPIVMSKLTINESPMDSLIMPFKEHVIINGVERKRIIFLGIVIDYFMTSSYFDGMIDMFCIQENGSLLISKQNMFEWENYESIREKLMTENIIKFHNDNS